MTAEDIEEIGAKGDPQDGKLSYREMKEMGVLQVKRQPGDNYGYIAFEDFVSDPEAHPLDTPSGKLEIYCQSLANLYNAMGWSTIKPIPTYTPVTNGYESTFSDWEGKTKGEFPLQLVNPHYLRRAHTVFDNVSWLREAWANPVFLSTEDAADAGIADGDTVLVSTAQGSTVRIASVIPTVRPGVVALPHGTWVMVDEETGVEQAGSDNYLTACAATGQGVSGYNSQICKIEKHAGAALDADVAMPPRIPLKDGE